ncbi:hypothetical protein LOTGIDRAFT_114702 [Lottia gigantea]|uniref:Cupin-like domain-containing protein n=1 Tax=Lottia gigantea TaxID=225164 RepID=V4ATW7_LOTGI|nr:hypothetical protein LOTGIDRAFT_114702 [Lottia gigantea]ESO98350.1 hypothetical protein LOTGIDRAFT_114702 [Lottia gigantea]
MFVLFFIIWFVNWPVERHQLASTLLSLKGLDNKFHDFEECIVELPGDVQKYFRPPVTCEFCQNVTHIPRVSGITPNEFEENYAYSGHPIVVVDATKTWTAMNVYNFKFFQDVHKNVTEENEGKQRTSCQFFPYKTKFQGLEDVFNMSVEKAYMKDGSPPWYIGWKNCDYTVGSILRKHYSRPYFLPVLAESSKTDWIFMGSPGYGAHLHIDNVGNPSWQAQITGNKRWILEPPPECYYTCTPHMEIVVKPGEIMVLDANMWYHQTIIEGDEIAIAIGSEYD